MRKRFLSSALILSTLLAACQPQSRNTTDYKKNPSTGIIDGKLVNEDDPFLKRVVLLHAELGTEFFRTCTATPISRTVLLTAAHCLEGATAVNVFFGTTASAAVDYDYFFSSDSRAEKIIYHEKYNSAVCRNPYDIGLVKLKNPIPADYKVSALFESGDMISDGRINFVGYGITAFDRKDDGILRKVTKSSAGMWISGPLISFKSAICPGDSGGPAFANIEGNYKIFGITIAVSGVKGTDLCRQDNYSLYVPYHRTWIDTAMKKLD